MQEADLLPVLGALDVLGQLPEGAGLDLYPVDPAALVVAEIEVAGLALDRDKDRLNCRLELACFLPKRTVKLIWSG